MRYTVKYGDTITSIAHAFGIRPFDLLLFNTSIYSERSYLPVGSELYIPKRHRAMESAERIDCECEFGQRNIEELLPQLKEGGLQVEIIGYSVMKKPIYAFAIGRGKKEIFYSGGWHANEWHTSKFLMLFLEKLMKYDQKKEKWYRYDVTQILNEVKLYIVPLVNPDGVDLVLQGAYEGHPYYEDLLYMNKGIDRFDHWSSNIRGVDLNHQWPAGWELEAKGSPKQPWARHYSGKAPLTEPEAIAVHQFTLKQSFEYVLTFHSQGQVIYWGYRGLEPKESEKMVNRLSLVSSYTPVQTADSDAGYKDWFIKEMKRPGFTIEMGVGTNPLPPSAFAEIWSNNLLLALEGLTL
ncbi:LysM peptidoglycan-binding domain-containing protein [bacterium LRH843]|nr:LysM peptidoglycan-binding domain-containing protein [bacterium LRH843]